jgi:hypothetical protein
VTTSKQVAQWEKGQDAFINATGGSFPNPNNQKDQASWIAAQRASDAMFKAQMGTPAFIVQNLGAGRYKQP